MKKTHPKAATDKLKRRVVFNYVKPISCIYHQSSGSRLSQPDGHVVAEGDDVLLSPPLFQPDLTGSCTRHHLSLPIQDHDATLFGKLFYIFKMKSKIQV